MSLSLPPANQNFLGKNGFQFFVQKLPNTQFYVQECNIPGINIDPVFVGNPLISLPLSGDHITYDELTITFKVDEDLGAYIDIFTWLRGLGFPESSSEYANISSQPFQSGFGIVSDATLLILDAKKRPNYKITFENAFPISLTSIQMSTTGNEGGAEYLTTTASFRFDNFDLERVKAGSEQWVVDPGG